MALSKLKNFIASESGAVTVDWVVLTAAIVTLGVAVMLLVTGGVLELGGEISTYLTDLDAPAITYN